MFEDCYNHSNVDLIMWLSRCVALTILLGALAADPVVQLPKGWIRGSTIQSINNKTIHVFLGIPFAKPPLGELRFKAPEEPEPWQGVLDVLLKSNICYSSAYDNDEESEDCLYLNVVTPVLELNETKTKLPVIVSIYGGGFRAGSAGYGNHSPDWWVEQDLVYINFNYRVGTFGFLSTGDTLLPGNYGLKDQYLALKWAHENAHLFGGDKNQITIHGPSAGGASVTYQLLHKKSKGLFRAAIAESGSAFSNWAYSYPSPSFALQLITIMNDGITPDDHSTSFIYNYLTNASAKAIDTATEILGKDPVPTIEPEHEGSFITQFQYLLMESGDFNQVPLLIGINSEEHIARAANLESLNKSASSLDQDLTKAVPDSLGELTDANKRIVGQIIRDLYVGDGETFTNHLGGLVALQSDNDFTRPTIRFAEIHAQYAPVWFYQFSYKGRMGNGVNVSLAGADNVGHGEELYYYTVYKQSNFDNTNFTNFPESDVSTHFRIIELWTNFIKYLNPTPGPSEILSNLTWPKVVPGNYSYLNFNTTLEIKKGPKSPKYEGWLAIFQGYGIPPFEGF